MFAVRDRPARSVVGFILAVAVAALTPAPAQAQDHYPLMTALDNSDIIFNQLEEGISDYYVAVQNGKPIPPLAIYAYNTRKGDDLFGLAARVGMPYDTIATLNRLSKPMTFPPGTHLLLPDVPAIFVPTDPASELEYLMASWRSDSSADRGTVRVFQAGAWRSYLYFPGEQFHPLERAYFLGILFRFPLPKGVITSPFGMRVDPFTHTEMFHSGIDIGAPWGTDVYAARGGVVEAATTDREYGNYIILRHDDGYQTVYGHLSRILVELNQRVTSGMIIGKVGSTGMSTGPHLHFEIRRNGKPEDPLPLLPKGGR